MRARRAVSKKVQAKGRAHAKEWCNAAAERHFAAGFLWSEIGGCEGNENRQAWYASITVMDEVMDRLEDLGLKPSGRIRA